MIKKLTTLLFVFAVLGAYAQIRTPQPSPSSVLEQKVGLMDVTVNYSRPGVKGRTIFGGLVPFGEKWRTGANSNTVISFSDNVTIGGKELKKGSYGIYTIPNKDSWEVFFYSETDKDAKVVLRATAQVQPLSFFVETFTISIDNITNSSAVLGFIWENTYVGVKFEVATSDKVIANIKRVMAGPSSNDYYAAGNFYFQDGQDLEKALSWVSKAIEMRKGGTFWMVRTKALILAKMGNHKDAIAAANESIAQAKKAGNKGYVRMNEKSIAEWSKN